MKIEFGVYTDITELYKKHSTSLSDGDGYIRFFICNDVFTFWLIRIIENHNADYEFEEGVYILERNNIEKEFKGEELTINKIIDIIKNDEFDNYDVDEYYDFDEMISDIDGGYGINK